MKNIKKVVALVLALAMILSLSSIAAFAELEDSSDVRYFDSDGTQLTGSTPPESKRADGYNYTFNRWVPTEYVATYEKGPFESALPNVGSFLYRVGSQNDVKLSSLFKLTDDSNVGTSNIRVTISPEANGTVTLNGESWENGTIRFNKEGPVTVIISEGNGIETSLPLEVVNGWNVTSYSELQNRNSVLLNDIEMSEDSQFAFSNAALYGNGFTFDVTKGRYTGTYDSTNYLLSLSNAVLNNVNVKGAVYETYGGTASSSYNNAAVLVKKSSRIENCTISNCATPVRVLGEGAEIVNSTLRGGVFANLDIRNGIVTLENVTTINQSSDNDKSKNGRTVVGAGIVAYYEGVKNQLHIYGTLTQYNSVSKSDQQYVHNTYANQIFSSIFDSAYSQYQATDENGIVWTNTGIISMDGSFDYRNIFVNGNALDETGSNGLAGYAGMPATAYGQIGYVYAPLSPTAKTPEQPIVIGQYDVAPTASFNYPNSEDCSYSPSEEALKVYYDSGRAASFNPKFLTLLKYGNELSYSVMLDGHIVEGDSVTFKDEEVGTHSHLLTYLYTDTFNYKLTKDGIVVLAAPRNYQIDLSVTTVVHEPTAKNASFTFGAENISSTIKELTGYGEKRNVAVPSGRGQNWDTFSFGGEEVPVPVVEMVTSDGKTKHTSAWNALFAVFKETVTITDYMDSGFGDAITYDASTTTMPTGLEVIGQDGANIQGFTAFTGGAKPAFCYGASKDNMQDKSGVVGGVLYYFGPKGLDGGSNTREDQSFVVMYQYTDNAGVQVCYFVKYHCAKQEKGGSCVTEDTLITLADRSQVPVKDLTGDEQLLVWNLETGSYDSAPMVFVDSDPEGEYSIIHAWFDDGTDVEIISSHGFFDLNLGEYVYLDSESSESYIGHSFVKQAGAGWDIVKLSNVTYETRVATPYSPVTFGHLCYYVNGMLSMPGGISGLFNIFDVDKASMSYNQARKASDLNTYGYMFLDDYGGMIPEVAYEAFNGAYLGVSMAKGLLSWEDIEYLAARYMPQVDDFDFSKVGLEVPIAPVVEPQPELTINQPQPMVPESLVEIELEPAQQFESGTNIQLEDISTEDTVPEEALGSGENELDEQELVETEAETGQLEETTNDVVSEDAPNQSNGQGEEAISLDEEGNPSGTEQSTSEEDEATDSEGIDGKSSTDQPDEIISVESSVEDESDEISETNPSEDVAPENEPSEDVVSESEPVDSVSAQSVQAAPLNSSELYPSSFEVKFLVDGKVWKTETWSYSTAMTPTLPTAPQRVGYKVEWKVAAYTASYSRSKIPFTITWKNEENLTNATYYYGDIPSFNGTEPTKEANAQYAYTFKGWTPEIVAVTDDATYTAQFNQTLKQYNVTFKDEDNTVLQSGRVNYGATPAFSKATPTKATDGTYTYTFAGWKSSVNEKVYAALPAVTGDVEYTATFASQLTTYTIKFVNDDGTVIKECEVISGQMPEAPADPSKAEIKAGPTTYTFTFSGWAHEVVPASADATYTATYSVAISGGEPIAEAKVETKTEAMDDSTTKTTTTVKSGENTVVEMVETVATTENKSKADNNVSGTENSTVKTTETATVQVKDAGGAVTSTSTTVTETTATESYNKTVVDSVETVTYTAETKTTTKVDDGEAQTDAENTTKVELVTKATEAKAEDDSLNADAKTAAKKASNTITSEKVDVAAVVSTVLEKHEDAATVKVDGNKTEVNLKVELELRTTLDKTDIKDTASAENSTVTYDVTPYAVVMDANNDDAKIAEEPVSNEQISATVDAPVTFRLPIPTGFAEVGSYIRVTHKSDVYGDEVLMCQVLHDTESNYDYVEVSVTHFSAFEIEASSYVTVTFNANGGVGGNSSKLTYGSAVTAPTVSRSGYTFTGWSPAFSATATADVTYTAQWRQNVTPTYSSDDSSSDDDSSTTAPQTTTIVDESTPLSEFPIFYVDVADNSWYHDAIAYVTALELMNGVGDNHFAPNDNTTRGMVAVVMMRLAKGEAVDLDSFFDVADSAYYAEAAAWAVENGVFKGYDDGSFRGEINITREQFAAVLYRYALAKGYDVSAKADLSAYDDGALVGGYASDAMAWAIANGIIKGVGNNRLDPLGNATRAQLATMLMRFDELRDDVIV